MKTDEFVKQINSLRLQNKNKWYTYQGTVNNKTVALKGMELGCRFCEWMV